MNESFSESNFDNLPTGKSEDFFYPMNESDSYYRGQAEQYFQQAYQKQSEGQLDEAVELYQKSIELYPTPEAHTFLGWAYSFKNRYDEAIEECNKAIELDPEYGNPYNDIGAYLIEQNKFEEAIPWLEKATQARRYESYCFPFYNLGRIWEAKGNWWRAIDYYQKAVDDNPQYTLARKALERIQSILN